MPEVICLISSSPPPVARRSKTPPTTKQAPVSKNGAAKPAATATTLDMTADPSATAPETKKIYGDSTFSAATPQNSAPAFKNPSLRGQMTAYKDANAKMNDKDFVFVDDDDYSSEVDLSKTYSLNLSEMHERIKNKVAAETAAKADAPASSSPVMPVKSTTSAAPAKSPLSSRTRVIFTSNYENPAGQSRYRAPITAAAPKTLDKSNGMVNKEYVFLNADFSSSIDLDKMNDLGLPTAKRRKVTPEPRAHQISEKEKERHGLPGLFSSPVSTRSYNVKDIEKRGSPDPLIPLPKGSKAKLASATTEKHGLPDLFSSPGSTRTAVPEYCGTEAKKYSLPNLFNPSPSREKSTQAQLDAAMMRSFTRKSVAPQPTAKEASLPQPFKRTQNRVLDSDPITFTSSPDFAQMEKDRRKRREQALAEDEQLSEINKPTAKSLKVSVALETLDSDSDELPELPSLRGASRALTRTTSDTSHLTKSRSVAAPRPKPLARSKSMADPASKPKKRVAKTDDEKAAEVAEKAATKVTEAERKRLLKEEKERNKAIAQDLAKANMLKTDKKKSTPEMIVLFPQEMDKKLQETAAGFLSKLSVEYKNWAGAGATPGEVAGSGMIKNVVRWKRKVDAEHNEKEDIWEPVPRRIESEKHVLVHLLAKEFVELVTADEDRDLDEHALKLKSRFYDHKVIYLIEGLTSWQKKNANLRNRQFTAAVRAQASAVDETTSLKTTTSSRNRKKKPQLEYISDDLIEDALLSLQIKHKVLIHHTASLVDSAEWISIFTQHISTIPYRLQKMNLDTSFCMESGQVRAGEDSRDTFVKMLCEMRGVTAPVGWGVEAEIGGSVKQLVERFRREGKEALALTKKGANRDGAFTDRNVGKAISKRIHNVFMGRDPGSTDV